MTAQAVAEKEEISLGRQVRTGMLRNLIGSLSDAEALVVVKIVSVPTRELNQLRSSLVAQKADLTIVKNRLGRIAFRDLGWADLEKHLRGTCGVAPIRGELSPICKLLATFSKDHEGFTLEAGVLKGQFLTSQDLASLASMPSREALLAQLAGVIQSPLRQLAFLAQHPLRSMVLLLQGLAQKKEKGVSH